MTPPRRKTDEDDRDYTPERGVSSVHRYRPLNGHTKWVVTVVSAAVVASLGYFLVRDRVGVDTHINRLDNATTAQASINAVQQAEIAVLKAKQDRVLEDLRENGRKLDEVLKELRR